MRRAILTAILSIGAGIAVAACGGGDKEAPLTRPTTVAEYASLICDPDDLPDAATWGEAAAKLDRDIDRVSNIIPQQSTVAAMKHAVGLIKDQDSNARFNPFELATDDDYLTLLVIQGEVEAGLSEGDKGHLRNAGCNVE